MFDRRRDSRPIVQAHRRKAGLLDRPVERDGQLPQLLEQRDPRVVTAKVGQQKTVHPGVAYEPSIACDLVLSGADDLQNQHLTLLRQHGLDARDERREERVRPQQRRIPGNHKTERERTRVRQCPGTLARLPAELVHRRQDPRAGLLSEPRPVVHDQRHRTLRDARTLGDIRDGGPPVHHVELPIKPVQ